jgi:glycerophosphoryl diester phosphodiesterase
MPPKIPIIVAHRGLHREHPENSLAAFLAAVDAKVPWVECDVWPSAKGVPVVIHDETLDRTTSGTGPVNLRTWQVLDLLGVPPLGEVLAGISDRAAILVEIKPPGARKFVSAILPLLQSHAGPWILQSFHAQNISHLWRTFPAAMLVEDLQNLEMAVESDCPKIHSHHSLINQELVEWLHASGREIGAWTVNDATEIQRMIDLGIDMLITDEPELAMQMIAKQSL